jgi:hypothetical protein
MHALIMLQTQDQEEKLETLELMEVQLLREQTDTVFLLLTSFKTMDTRESLEQKLYSG